MRRVVVAVGAAIAIAALGSSCAAPGPRPYYSPYYAAPPPSPEVYGGAPSPQNPELYEGYGPQGPPDYDPSYEGPRVGPDPYGSYDQRYGRDGSYYRR